MGTSQSHSNLTDVGTSTDQRQKSAAKWNTDLASVDSRFAVFSSSQSEVETKSRKRPDKWRHISPRNDVVKKEKQRSKKKIEKRSTDEKRCTCERREHPANLSVSAVLDPDVVRYHPVTFDLIKDHYEPGQNILALLKIAGHFTQRSTDWVGLYHADWTDLRKFVCYKPAPRHSTGDRSQAHIRSLLFTSRDLRAVTPSNRLSYQLVYVGRSNRVMGLSSKFKIYFRAVRQGPPVCHTLEPDPLALPSPFASLADFPMKNRGFIRIASDACAGESQQVPTGLHPRRTAAVPAAAPPAVGVAAAAQTRSTNLMVARKSIPVRMSYSEAVKRGMREQDADAAAAADADAVQLSTDLSGMAALERILSKNDIQVQNRDKLGEGLAELERVLAAADGRPCITRLAAVERCLRESLGVSGSALFNLTSGMTALTDLLGGSFSAADRCVRAANSEASLVALGFIDRLLRGEAPQHPVSAVVAPQAEKITRQAVVDSVQQALRNRKPKGTLSRKARKAARTTRCEQLREEHLALLRQRGDPLRRLRQSRANGGGGGDLLTNDTIDCIFPDWWLGEEPFTRVPKPTPEPIEEENSPLAVVAYQPAVETEQHSPAKVNVELIVDSTNVSSKAPGSKRKFRLLKTLGKARNIFERKKNSMTNLKTPLADAIPDEPKPSPLNVSPVAENDSSEPPPAASPVPIVIHHSIRKMHSDSPKFGKASMDDYIIASDQTPSSAARSQPTKSEELCEAKLKKHSCKPIVNDFGVTKSLDGHGHNKGQLAALVMLNADVAPSGQMTCAPAQKPLKSLSSTAVEQKASAVQEPPASFVQSLSITKHDPNRKASACQIKELVWVNTDSPANQVEPVRKPSSMFSSILKAFGLKGGPQTESKLTVETDETPSRETPVLADKKRSPSSTNLTSDNSRWALVPKMESRAPELNPNILVKYNFMSARVRTLTETVEMLRAKLKLKTDTDLLTGDLPLCEQLQYAFSKVKSISIFMWREFLASGLVQPGLPADSYRLMAALQEEVLDELFRKIQTLVHELGQATQPDYQSEGELSREVARMRQERDELRELVERQQGVVAALHESMNALQLDRERAEAARDRLRSDQQELCAKLTNTNSKYLKAKNLLKSLKSPARRDTKSTATTTEPDVVPTASEAEVQLDFSSTTDSPAPATGDTSTAATLGKRQDVDKSPKTNKHKARSGKDESLHPASSSWFKFWGVSKKAPKKATPPPTENQCEPKKSSSFCSRLNMDIASQALAQQAVVAFGPKNSKFRQRA